MGSDQSQECCATEDKSATVGLNEAPKPESATADAEAAVPSDSPPKEAVGGITPEPESGLAGMAAKEEPKTEQSAADAAAPAAETAAASSAADAGDAPKEEEKKEEQKEGAEAAGAAAATNGQANGIKPAAKQEDDDKEEELSKQELIAKAKVHMRKHACTKWDDEKQTYVWMPLCCTKTSDFGRFGVGVRLYFDFLFQMGICFLLLTLVAAPSFYMNMSGNMIDESNPVYQWLGKMSISNLGYCQGGQCSSREEVLNRGYLKDNTEKLRDFTKWLGMLDGVAVLLLMSFGLYFVNFWIPRAVRQTDDAHITAADFAVQVSFLPRRLAEGHQQYKTKLKDFFANLLKEKGIADANAVQEINLVRDYHGHIGGFMNEGSALDELYEAEGKLKKAQEKGKEKAIKGAQKSVDKKQAKYDKIHNAKKEQGTLKDEDRDVFQGFVIFNKEEYKDEIMKQYRFSRSRFLWCCQSRRLKFEKGNIRVDAAPEPTDLTWENMDFGRHQRRCRRIVVVIVATIILIICMACLVLSQSIKASAGEPAPTRAWIIKNAKELSPCMRVCEFKLFKSRYCYSDISNSADWTVQSVFDANGASTVGARASIFDGVDSCTNSWTSPQCSQSAVAGINQPTTGKKDNDWIGIEFKQDRTVRKDVQCMTLHRPDALVDISELQLYACSKKVMDDIKASGDYKNFKPEAVCSSMQLIKPKTNGAPMIVAPDSTCAASVDLKYVQKVIKEGVDAAKDPSIICYCKQQLTALGPDFRLPPYNTPGKQACEKYHEAENKKVGMMVAGVLAVLVLNQVLNFAFATLVDWVRMRTITEVTESKMLLLLVSLCINTAILTLLVNWTFLKSLPLTIGDLFSGTFFDLDRSFFPSIGSSLCITIALQSVSNTAPPVVMFFIVSPLMAKWYQRGAVTKSALYKIYMLPEWNISLRLAQVMNVIICVMMYSGPMPILYVVGFIYCVFSYWVDKWVLLRGSCKPPAYNQEIIKVAASTFPVAALLHTLVTLWIFGNQELFPSNWSVLTGIIEPIFGMKRDEATKIIQTYKGDTDTYADYAQARCISIAREGTVLLCLVFLAFVALHILRIVFMILRPFLWPLEMCLVKCWSIICCKRKKGPSATEDAYDKAKEDMLKNGIVKSYEIADNPRYLKAAKALEVVNEQAEATEQAV